MNIGKTFFARLMDFLPWTTFARYVERYGGDRGIRTLPGAEQFPTPACLLQCGAGPRSIATPPRQSVN